MVNPRLAEMLRQKVKKSKTRGNSQKQDFKTHHRCHPLSLFLLFEKDEA